RQGPRVAGSGNERNGARTFSAGPGGGTTEWAGGGAPALLRRPHPRQGQALSDLGPSSAPGWRASAGDSIPLPEGHTTRDRGRTADYVSVGAGLVGGTAGRAERRSG